MLKKLVLKELKANTLDERLKWNVNRLEKTYTVLSNYLRAFQELHPEASSLPAVPESPAFEADFEGERKVTDLVDNVEQGWSYKKRGRGGDDNDERAGLLGTSSMDEDGDGSEEVRAQRVRERSPLANLRFGRTRSRRTPLDVEQNGNGLQDANSSGLGSGTSHNEVTWPPGLLNEDSVHAVMQTSGDAADVRIQWPMSDLAEEVEADGDGQKYELNAENGGDAAWSKDFELLRPPSPLLQPPPLRPKSILKSSEESKRSSNPRKVTWRKHIADVKRFDPYPD
ncbi:hypothetical protein HDU93_001960 [Gonapodya sp. JEL0774]|nr:hypothetical protein HDU93_001960 [Gonapodya sp. JEL0774]